MQSREEHTAEKTVYLSRKKYVRNTMKNATCAQENFLQNGTNSDVVNV